MAEPLAELLNHEVSTWEQRGFSRIKERTVRSVFCGLLGSVPVHIKVFRADKISDLARDALRGQRGAREVRHLSRARSLGLPAVEPLAFGMATDAGGRRSFVVTRSLTRAEPFTFGMPAAILARTGALLRRIHDCGVLAADLHSGNLLIDDGGEPWLIDLTSFRHGGEPSLEQRARGLALFCQTLDGGPLDRRARPLLSAYRDAGPALDAAFTAELTAATRRWRAAALPAFGRRSQRNCRHTRVERRRRATPQWFWHRDDESDEAEQNAARALADEPPAPTKSGRRGAVWLAETLVMKQREPSKARRLWRASYWLLFAGVPIARPVAMQLHRDRGRVLCARIANPPLSEELATSAGNLNITAIAAELGRAVGRLHAHGLRNRDLKLDNLVRIPGTDRVAMVDLDGIRKKASSDSRGCGADLGRLFAAYRVAGEPGGARSVTAFVRAYLRAQRDLLRQPPIRRVLKHAKRRAGEWAQAH